MADKDPTLYPDVAPRCLEKTYTRKHAKDQRHLQHNNNLKLA